MTCTWNEDIAAPRDVEVIYHDVEPLKEESDVVMVNSIMGVRI